MNHVELRQRLEARTARVGVVGLGYVGLPLAVEFARAGFQTTGIDLDQRKIDAVTQGTSYIPDVATEEVARLVSAEAACDDMRESPSLDVMHLLHEKGASVRYADPYVPALAARAWHGGFDMTTESLTPDVIAAADCVAILTEHRTVDYDMVVRSARLVVDTRNAIAGAHDHVIKLGAPAPTLTPRSEPVEASSTAA